MCCSTFFCVTMNQIDAMRGRLDAMRGEPTATEGGSVSGAGGRSIEMTSGSGVAINSAQQTRGAVSSVITRFQPTSDGGNLR